MNLFLSSLEKACRDYLLEEKILIVNGHRAGHEVCEALASEGGGWVNLRPETAGALAEQVALDYLVENGITVLPDYLCSAAVEKVFCDLEEGGMLVYFSREGDAAGVVNAIASSVLDLRQAGITAENFPRYGFVNKDKERDMGNILGAYEKFMQENNYLDEPGLLALAVEMASENEGGDLYLLPSFLRLTTLEREFVEKLAGSNLLVLDADPVYGFVSTPERPGSANSDIERLAWLYDVENAPAPLGDGSVSFFHAYGMNNEIREVFRRVQKEQLPLDRVTAACTTSEYIPGFYELAQSLGIGITVEEGIPVSFTGPGKALFKLADWIKNDFPVAGLKDMLFCGEIEFCFEDGEIIPSQDAVHVLRRSGIGWGRQRYSLLESLAGQLEEAAENNEGDKREYLLRRSRQAYLMYEVLGEFWEGLPVPDGEGRVDLAELGESIAVFLEKTAVIKSALDQGALNTITTTLKETGEVASLNIYIEEAAERVKEQFENLRVGASGPKPGHMHVTGFASLTWTNREHTFLVGLDAGAFPGGGQQDPVLLDAERSSIHSGLALSSRRPGENMYAMALALASRRGRVTLSFSSFDVVENREVFPSSLLLQVYRLLQGESSLDYSSLMNSLGKPAGYCSLYGDSCLDEGEWWLASVLTGPGIINLQQVMRECYSDTGRGLSAQKARQKPYPTEYDGLIEVDPAQFDPRQNGDIVLSAGKIEYLAGCPYAYFLAYVLELAPPEEIEYQPGRWLDAINRGSLLHELFYRFMERMRDNGEMPGAQKHRDLMMEMAEELAVEYRQVIPPPREVVFRRELNDIYRCCEVFLNAEEAQGRGVPEYLEMPFGYEEPVKIMLDEENSFWLKGKIDRIDRVDDGIYHVWDYKTGSAYGYDDHLHLCRGRQLQHALYAMAAEQVLQDYCGEESPQVEVSGYYFPTEKGEGQAVGRLQVDRQAACEVLHCLFDILAGGNFIPAEDGRMCGICEYGEVCGGEKAVQRVKDLLNRSDDLRLDPLRRLKAYD